MNAHVEFCLDDLIDAIGQIRTIRVNGLSQQEFAELEKNLKASLSDLEDEIGFLRAQWDNLTKMRPVSSWGMFSDAGNLAVEAAVQFQKNLRVATARPVNDDWAASAMEDILASVSALGPSFGEVYDTDVRERIYSALSEEA
jgi:hypothetical protein